MERVKGRTFTQEAVIIDGKHFVDCSFSDCTIEYNGKSMIFERTSLSGCHYFFGDDAYRTIQFLQLVGVLEPELWLWHSGLDKVTH